MRVLGFTSRAYRGQGSRDLTTSRVLVTLSDRSSGSLVGSGGAGLSKGSRGGRTVMSHAEKADKLLIKPTAGARPAPPRTRRQFIPKARTRRPVTRRVTRGTATTRLATAPDRPTWRVLPSPEGPAAVWGRSPD